MRYADIDLEKQNYINILTESFSKETHQKLIQDGYVDLAYEQSMQPNDTVDDTLDTDFFAMLSNASPSVRLELAEHYDKLATNSTDSNKTSTIAAVASAKQAAAEKAVSLYRSLGLIDRATRLAFDTGRHDNVELIADNISEQSGNAVVEKCVQYFTDNQQYERAALVLAKANRTELAVELISRYKVPLTQTLIETLVPSAAAQDHGTVTGSKLQEERERSRRSVAMTLAQMCARDGNDTLAARLYSEVGERAEAMRALIKSNNTEAVLRLAKTARQNELYVMAANYLQQRMEKENPERYEKEIVLMLEKSHESQRLATFYNHCAERAIEQHDGYDKAYAYYQKTSNVLQKSFSGQTGTGLGSSASARALAVSVEEKMKLIAAFNSAVQRVRDEPDFVLEQLKKLLNQCGWSEGLRRGDVLVAMAKILYKVYEDAAGAARVLEVLIQEVKQQRSLKLGEFVPREFVQRVFEEAGRKIDELNIAIADVGSDEKLKQSEATGIATTLEAGKEQQQPLLDDSVEDLA